nr:hypothetical protein [Tanacetum cinerariifolium]
APRSPEYVPDPIELEDHAPTHIPEHYEDLVPAEDEAPIEAYIPEVASAPTPPLPPSFLSPRIRPPRTRAAMAHMRAAVPSTYHSLLPSRTPPLAEIPEADTPPRKRLLLTAPRPGCEVGESSVAAAARQPRPTMARSVDCSFVDTIETSYQVDVRSRGSSEVYSRHHDAQKDRAAVRAKIEVLRRERLAYEQESIQTREALARFEAYSRALEARVAVLETQAHRHEWQRQTADDLDVQHIMRTQALEAGARIDTLENTCRAYAAGNNDRNIYTGSKPLCSKCDYHHEGKNISKVQYICVFCVCGVQVKERSRKGQNRIKTGSVAKTGNAPRSPEYVPDPIELEDHAPTHIPEHYEDLVPAEDEAPIEAYIPEVASAPTPPLPPSFLSPRIRPPRTRAAMAHMRAAVPSTYHSLLPSRTPPLLPIPLPRLLLTAPRPGCEVGESSVAAAARQPRPTMARSVDCSFVDTIETSYQVDVRSRGSSEVYSRHHDAQKDRAAVRAKIEVLRRERLAYEQESIQTREALARFEAYSRALEARVAVLETQAHRHEWQRQTADDLDVQHIMRTQALEAGARIDTLENTCRAYAAGNNDRNIYTGLKKDQERDKIRSKLDKNGKRGEAGKC